MVLLRKNIARHIRDQHTPKVRSRCPVCRKTYKTAEWLKDHMRRGHGLSKEESEQIMRENRAIVECSEADDNPDNASQEEAAAQFSL